MLEFTWLSICLGAGATALLDLWALLLNRLFALPKPNWALVGRWFAHLPRGTFKHARIADSAPVAGELVVGWIMHYVVGALFAAALLAIWGVQWTRTPTFLPALIVGIVTIGAGWFVLQPGMGAGIASSRTPNPTRARLMNIAGHVVFAIGLYGTALILAVLRR